MKKLAMSAVAAALLSTSALAEVTISGTTEFYYKSDDLKSLPMTVLQWETPTTKSNLLFQIKQTQA